MCETLFGDMSDMVLLAEFWLSPTTTRIFTNVACRLFIIQKIVGVISGFSRDVNKIFTSLRRHAA
jgi:hypothetical protein